MTDETTDEHPEEHQKVNKPNRNRFQRLMDALKDRCHRVIEVIDDALDSENLRDRIWAVDQLFKRLKLDAVVKKPTEKLHPKTIKGLSDDELMAQIHQLLNSECDADAE